MTQVKTITAMAESNGDVTEEALSIAECPQILENGLPEGDEQKHLGQIERDLDALTYTGTTINELEIGLMRSRSLYKRTLEECKQRLEGLRQRLNTSIQRSQPFLDVYRRAREIQEASNKAAARFDKANSQHAAAKEMICVAEQQLGDCIEDPVSPSALDLAWQEMLNHATGRVVETERERRDSELEHKQILHQCTKVMEEYRIIERKLRSHIVKSKPYFEERFRCQQRLLQIKHHIQGLEKKIDESKRLYATTLKKLETLNAEIHERRRSRSVSVSPSSSRHRRQRHPDGRKFSSARNTPEPEHRGLPDGGSDTESLDSLKLGSMKGNFTGSTGSLPSIGTSSVSDYCPTPDPNGKNGSRKNGESSGREEGNGRAKPAINIVVSKPDHSEKLEVEGGTSQVSTGMTSQGGAPVVKGDTVADVLSHETVLAQEVVRNCLESAAAKLRLEVSRTAQQNEESVSDT